MIIALFLLLILAILCPNVLRVALFLGCGWFVLDHAHLFLK
jgi:hypothetical protein